MGRRFNTSALGSIIASQQRTNARMDKTMFEGAENEFRRVGGQGTVEISILREQAAEDQAKAAAFGAAAKAARAAASNAKAETREKLVRHEDAEQGGRTSSRERR